MEKKIVNYTECLVETVKAFSESRVLLTSTSRDHDKFKEKRLTALPAKNVTSPIIKECLINFECKVIHKNDLIPSEIAPEIIPEVYPKDDFHRVFFGQILACFKNA
jgi:flavin reductase (DIM6/NTAB) family NADH-FMN oxidoreductase RutF